MASDNNEANIVNVLMCYLEPLRRPLTSVGRQSHRYEELARERARFMFQYLTSLTLRTAPKAQYSVIVDSDDVLKEGYLIKESKHLKSWRRRWCVLTPTCLCTFPTERLPSFNVNRWCVTSNAGRDQPSEYLLLAHCLSVSCANDETDEENCFYVNSPDRAFFLQAPSADEKQAWIEAICKALKAHKEIASGLVGA
mmetsp:Transcript_93248/g.145461  ORF Transcript_93248/g.145461 Transcript_93248/m.145461 type:complete len:196 (-) Transcript_93248:46-633(-)